MSVASPFEHHAPHTLAEALALVRRHGADARVIAGGTELVPKLRAGVLAPSHVISVNRIAELAKLAYGEPQGLRIGAGVRLHDVAKDPTVRRQYPALAQACSQMATPQIRHMGTVAGNLVNGSPCADTAGPLLVYEATVELASVETSRTVPLRDFFVDAGLVTIEPGEILVAIAVPVPPLRARSAFRRLSARSKVDVAAVNVAALVELDAQGTVATARVALGSVAPTPLRCADGEAALIGRRPEADALDAAAHRCAAVAKPIDDVRATAAYRRAVLPVLVRRVLEDCLAEPPSGSEADGGGA